MWAVPSFFRLISLVLNVGLSFSSCSTSMSVQDLGCHMHWSCSAVTTTTTFTVQTMIQGAEWQNVSHCVQISSSSCDLSQVFDEFDLYKFVRLELNQGQGQINLTPSQLCDPVKESSFSPPSLSLFLENQQLWVEVIFPCAPQPVCQATKTENEEVDEGGSPTCCPVTDFQWRNTTITLYNKHNPDDTQTHSEMVEESPWKLWFINFTPGQEYCAVARFASSPPSDTQCVHIPVPGKPNLPVLASGGVLLAVLLIVGFALRRWWYWHASTDIRLPKSLMSLQSLDQESSVVDEPRQADVEEEESIVHLSIISLNNLLSSNPDSFDPPSLGHMVRYDTTAALPDPDCDGTEDTHDYFRDAGTDGLSDCASSSLHPWPRWSSLPALRTGMVCLLGNFLPPEGSGIPLSSVRVAGEQVSKTGSDLSVKLV